MFDYAQCTFFQVNGYLVVNDLIPSALIDKVQAAARCEIAEHVRPYRLVGGSIARLDQLWDRNIVYREVIEHPRLLDAVEDLLGPNIEYLTRRHNHLTLNGPKHQVPGRGGAGLHRDSLQWSRPIVTVLVYLDDSTVDTGATRLIPGSHQLLPYVGLPSDGGGGNHLAEHEEYAGYADQALICEVPRGGVLLFNSLLFHSAGANRGTSERMSMTLGYRSVDELQPTPVGYAHLVRGQAIYRGNDVDTERLSWQGDIFPTGSESEGR
ncbi:phytanoyl-CoA dioxygenase family protein [Micromonospora sp. AP08]|uniref:phytanoyl-CoA dioxygenase family protein n=1 Tax=Micromonospora sp. AP08 TaxID=2604467 RepID=UPI001652974A|nr:phytanoyl-CoA dioxygenase family protein [Micromonospora sp. AP08]